MDDALKRKDYAGVLHSSASIFETLAKEVVGISSVQNQTLKSFFERYRKDLGLPDEVLNYILSVYDLRSSVPLAGHGHTATPQISSETAITLSEMTKAFVSIEYKLKGNEVLMAKSGTTKRAVDRLRRQLTQAVGQPLLWQG